MKPGKIALLALILGLGASLEVAWSVRHNLTVGPAGCRVLTGRFHGPSFAFESEETREGLPADLTLDVENAFGELRVVPGEPGRAQLGVRKVVYQETEARARELAGRIRASLELSGSTLKVRTNRREIEAAETEVGFETHLTLRVPPGTSVKVQNEHGRVEIADARQASVSNSFEPVHVERVTGPVDVDSRHAEVSVAFVGGALKLSSRHGDVSLSDVAGSATLSVEHGDVKAQRVGGISLRLQHGDLEATDLRGALEVNGQHAAVRAAGVRGAVAVETSYRDVDLSRVAGDCRVKAQHGAVKASEIEGGLNVDVTYDDVEASRVGGAVQASVQHGGFRGLELKQGARIHASGDDVRIEAFEGPVEIEAQRGSVRLEPQRAVSAPISVTSQNGSIHLEVPAGSRFDLEASTDRGEVRVDVKDLSPERSGPRRVTGRLGGGGRSVRLVARTGDVTVESGGAGAGSI